MNGKIKQGGYNYEEFKAQPLRERGFLESLVNYLGYGVSQSEIGGAHEDIDKLIENADPNAKIARLARVSQGRDIEDLFRVLNPDSTIKVVSSMADRYYAPNRYGSVNEATHTKASEQLINNPESKGMDKNLASFLLAAARNNPYSR